MVNKKVKVHSQKRLGFYCRLTLVLVRREGNYFSLYIRKRYGKI